MADNTTALYQLKGFLNQLFQFDSQDLDFGVYKILHYKRKEIKNFLDKLLVDKVKQQLRVLTTEETEIVNEQLANLMRDVNIKAWISGDKTTRDVLESIDKDKINRYLELKGLSTEARASVETENQIYNHLTLFFSRYYDKGDFISKRRFGKNEKYVVPYNGEETHFHWANHDQYYIKSSETFQKYAFKIATQSGNMVVNFKLTEAQMEQGNVKADETNYFVLSGKPTEISDSETTFFFEYRPLTDDEKKNIKGNSKQDTLNEQAFEQIRQETQEKVATLNALWKTDDDGKALLLKKLNQYTRKNLYDFFIHKNLKGFLERELDFYIKSELINVDDLYVSEAEAHFNRLKHNLKTIKVFKSIADTIIAFVSQIEDFQKKLWEKKKFVLSTEWVITIDRLIEYIGLEATTPILEEILKNEKQVEEWKELFSEEFLPENMDHFKADLYTWKKLPIDTVHFKSTFKTRLLNALSNKILIEENLNGIVGHSDNYQYLNTIEKKYCDKISCIHIDPPYNTDTSGFIYKNGYRTSSWLSMMEDRFVKSIDLINDHASVICHIDEYEYENLYNIFRNKNFPYLGTVVWDKKNPMMGGKGLAGQHEYIIWGSRYLGQFESKSENVKVILTKAKEIVSKHKGVSEKSRKEFSSWVKSFKNLSGGERMYNLLEEDGQVYRLVSMSWPNPKKAPDEYFTPLIHPVTKKECPVPSRGWSKKPDTMQDLILKDEIVFGKDESTVPQRKVYLSQNKNKPIATVISNGKKGKAELEQLGLAFSYCHPTSLYEEINFSTIEKDGYLIDFFAGSGTNFHAIQLLNSEDKGNRKTILVEQGIYVYSLIIPRIKKIAYTFDWKDGKPKDGSMNGLGVFFKYQRLEQYEESLENIAFTAPVEATQMALEVDSYLPKYFLEFETKGSQALVNTTAMQDPWNYTLKVWDGFTYDTEQTVDLVETFNYLIGLHMQKCFTKQINGKKYQFIHGHNNANKKITVVWRSVKGWELEDYRLDGEALNEELKDVVRDLLYINDQANVDNYQPIEEVFKNKMLP